MTVTVTVTNTAENGPENMRWNYTAAIYMRALLPANKRLRAFEKIDLKAGESKQVKFVIDKNDLAFVNAQLQTVTEPGDFEVLVG